MSWTDGAVAATARDDVADAVRAALREAGTLHAWAARQQPREEFQGRGAAYGVRLGEADVVVRHAHRGGWLAPLLHDRYLGAPRYLTEIAMADRLRAAGVRTPAVLAGVAYRAGVWHRADVATARVRGRDLAALFYGDPAPKGELRGAVLEAVGSAVRRLHDAGFVHPDLQLRNVLVAEGCAVWLLDVDTCRTAAGAADRAANLERFRRSWARWNARVAPRLTPADWAVMERAYREGP